MDQKKEINKSVKVKQKSSKSFDAKNKNLKKKNAEATNSLIKTLIGENKKISNIKGIITVFVK